MSHDDYVIPVSGSTGANNENQNPSPLRDCVTIKRVRGEAIGFQSLGTRFF